MWVGLTATTCKIYVVYKTITTRTEGTTMHSMKPNTTYKTVILGLVCQNESEAALADGINEMLRDSNVMDDPQIVDYSIDFSGPIVTSDDEPEEGDLTHNMARAVLLETLVNEAQTLFDGCSKEENPEYLRGMTELIAGVCGAIDVDTEQSAKNVAHSILKTSG